MFKHLLVPTDGSELSRHTAAKAIAFARETGARITFFTALPDFPVSFSEGYGITDPGTRARLVASAEAQGHSILDPLVAAASADELLAHLPAAQDAPQVLLADLCLAGGRTGPGEVQRLCSAWQRELPVLWISGETATDGLRARLPAGAAVLTKPVSPARVRAWLEQRLPGAPPAEPGEQA